MGYLTTTKPEKTRELTTLQTAFLDALFGEANGDPLKAGELAGYSQNSWHSVVKALKSDIIERAERIQLGMLQKGRQILIRYAQGQLSYAAGQRQFQANAAFAAGHLKVILGSEGYARVRDSLFSNPVVQSGLKQLLLR